MKKIMLLTPALVLTSCASVREFLETMTAAAPDLIEKGQEAAVNGPAGWIGYAAAVLIPTLIGACFKRTRPATVATVKTVTTFGINQLLAWLKRRREVKSV